MESRKYRKIYFLICSVSQSSYGSHKNRDFETTSHRCSVEELDEERNQVLSNFQALSTNILNDFPFQANSEKLAFLMMNGGNSGHRNGILSKGGPTTSERPQRSVVIGKL